MATTNKCKLTISCNRCGHRLATRNVMASWAGFHLPVACQPCEDRMTAEYEAQNAKIEELKLDKERIIKMLDEAVARAAYPPVQVMTDEEQRAEVIKWRRRWQQAADANYKISRKLYKFATKLMAEGE